MKDIKSLSWALNNLLRSIKLQMHPYQQSRLRIETSMFLALLFQSIIKYDLPLFSQISCSCTIGLFIVYQGLGAGLALIQWSKAFLFIGSVLMLLICCLLALCFSRSTFNTQPLLFGKLYSLMLQQSGNCYRVFQSIHSGSHVLRGQRCC